jgi:AcrR family transcriptional regulator
MTFKSFYHLWRTRSPRSSTAVPIATERDPATGKFRNRWTYLGRGDHRGAPASIKPRANAREALLGALERLLDRNDVGDVTAALISSEAGLAHGTFYRYFRNRDDAIKSLAEQLRSQRVAALGLIDEPPVDGAAARTAFRAWTTALLQAKTQHYGVVRALLALATHDAAMRAAFQQRREEYGRRLAVWLRGLTDRAIISLAAPETAASMIFAMVDGIGREANAAADPLDDDRITAAVDLIERAVFGTPASP